MDDYPNSSETMDWNVEKPEERKEAEQKEDARVTSSMPVVSEHLKWLQERIEHFSNPANYEINETMSDQQIARNALNSKHLATTYANELYAYRLRFAKYLEPADEA